jgi:hypothetical protein
LRLGNHDPRPEGTIFGREPSFSHENVAWLDGCAGHCGVMNLDQIMLQSLQA